MTNKNALEALDKIERLLLAQGLDCSINLQIARTALSQPANKMMLDALNGLVLKIEDGHGGSIGNTDLIPAYEAISAASSAPVVEVEPNTIRLKYYAGNEPKTDRVLGYWVEHDGMAYKAPDWLEAMIAAQKKENENDR